MWDTRCNSSYAKYEELLIRKDEVKSRLFSMREHMLESLVISFLKCSN